MSKGILSIKCWNTLCKMKKRIDLKEMVERKEDKEHYDYCCPKCGVVLICTNKRIK